ncbi:hypothetical protein CVT24_008704, partial [Panaeolus cyanescens]
DPSGEHKCDFVIAVTHSRIPNDIKVARALGALSRKAQENTDITSTHGVDILLGGHDHIYGISKGVTEWNGYDINSHQKGADDDKGDTLVITSGTDFQDLSEVILELKDTPAGSVRRKMIQKITGNCHITRQSTPVDASMKSIIDTELGTINAAMFSSLRFNWMFVHRPSGYRRPTYDEALRQMGYPKTACVVACCGDFRGDGVYEPGLFTLNSLMTVLPYDDPTIVLELDANGLWDTLESGLSRWPIHEGRFPSVSGMRLTEQDPNKPGVPIDKEEVKRTSTRKYFVMVGDYMAQGGDGYNVLKNKKQIITTENGQFKGALIRKLLLGAQYLNKQITEKPEARVAMSDKTTEIVGNFEARLPDMPKFNPENLLKIPSFKSNLPGLSTHDLGISTIRWVASGLLLAAALAVADTEDMGLLDPYERVRKRHMARLLRTSESVNIHLRTNLRSFRAVADSGVNEHAAADAEDAKVDAADADAKKTLPVIHPVIDGRLKDVART